MKLSKAQRVALEREARQCEEDSMELARRVQRIRRQLADDKAGRPRLKDTTHAE